MGESDDEYDRKRGRDKFRGERSGDRENERERWPERERPRPRNDGYYRSSRYSPPPMKRMRGDYEDRGHHMGRFGGGGGPPPHMDYGAAMYGGYDPYGALNPFGQGAPMVAPTPREPHPPVSDGLTQPAMMTLKQFLATQDDSISDEIAVTKYNEYKVEFKRSQLNEFFVAHKDEEWFKLKYHPELSFKRKEEQIGYLKARVDVFLELLVKGDIPRVNVDTSNTEQLIRLLDTVVIKLEGGSDDDLKVLDEKPVVITPIVPKPAEEKSKPEETIADKAEQEKSVEKEVKDEEKSEKRESKKRKRSSEGWSSNSSDSSSSDSDSESENNPKSPEKKETSENGDKMENDENGDTNQNEEKPSEDVEMKAPEEKETVKNEEIDNDTVKVDEIVVVPEDDEPKVKKLEEKHKTSSIFVRNLAPTITKAEVEALCKKYDGFLRVAIADPAVERRWFRRGWITFKRDVNIKEICWNLNNIRLRDCELAPIVNRDLSRRVRPVNGITAHKTICKNDIKICAKIAHSLDEKYGLWNDRSDESEGQKQAFGLQSKNPVLKNITDYLIEEADAEEEELLGLSSESKDDSEGEIVERDPNLISVLDKIVLYLRIVHSVDFYNHCEYPYEDEMPNRCGIIHARGPQPQNKVNSTEIQDYIKNFDNKISQFLTSSADVPQEELKKLGAKDIDAEVEKFITANSQELAKDKWLCPLSGKKFKGPDYIRKHIFNKHAEKVEEVKKEVEYFNNYLKDSKRPQLPEHPGNVPKKENPPNANMFRPHFTPMPYNPYGGYAPMPHRGRGGFSRGGRMDMGHRPIINYRDLDAEKPDDFF